MEAIEQVADSNECIVLSKRKLIRALSLIGAEAALGPFAIADARAAFCYGPGKVPLNDDTIYPLLAVWLLLTTNKQLVPDSLDKQTEIAGLLNMDPGCVKTIISTSGLLDPSFDPVRDAFDKVVKGFSTTFYSGGHCPGGYTTITRIGRLSPSLSFGGNP